MLRHIDRAEEYLACALLVALGTLLTVQIALRYLFGLGWGWMEELARVGFIWVIFLGAVVGMRRHLHIRVSLGLRLFPGRLRAVAEAVGDLVLLAFCLAMAWHGAELVWSTVEVDFRLSHTGMSMFWPYLVVPLSFALQAVRIVVRHLHGRTDAEGV
ncbi:MAG: TRAP transporter small permease [Ectothiorhodospiraceae bacterium]|nr:TRAP transporter small permease [Chromatiales bacterium]MCP5154804.1 TRAP transporter small permease [Ectothiorhodospiraceae bacterium]